MREIIVFKYRGCVEIFNIYMKTLSARGRTPRVRAAFRDSDWRVAEVCPPRARARDALSVCRPARGWVYTSDVWVRVRCVASLVCTSYISVV